MGKLKPLETAPAPGYPVRWLRDGSRCASLRKAAATTTATLALCLTACDPAEEQSGAEQGVAGDNVAEQADAGDRAVPQPDAGRPNDPLMNGQTAGMPLALGLDGEERAPAPPPGSDGTITPPATPPVVPVLPPSVPPVIHQPPPPTPPVVVTPEPPKPPTKVVPPNYPIRPAGGPRIIRRPGRRSGG